MNSFQENKKQLTTTEAAKFLGLSASTLNVWRCKRKGPAYRKVGSKIFYPIKSLEQYLENCTISLS